MSNNSLLFAPGLPVNQPGTGYKNTLQGSWVEDSAGNVWWLQTETDETGNITFSYYDQPGGVVGSPVLPVQPVQDSNVQVIKRCDDINNDGSVLVTFYRLNVYDEEGSILSSNPQTASGGPYVIIGTECDANDDIVGQLEQITTNTGATATNTGATATNTGATATNTATTATNTGATATASQQVAARTAGSFINFDFDEVDLTYVSAGAAIGEVETATYKLSSVVQATITITYDSSTGNITNVERS